MDFRVVFCVMHCVTDVKILFSAIFLTLSTLLLQKASLLTSKTVHFMLSAPLAPFEIKFTGVKSKIVIKYKRIKWTPSGKASLIPTRGIR